MKYSLKKGVAIVLGVVVLGCQMWFGIALLLSEIDRVNMTRILAERGVSAVATVVSIKYQGSGKNPQNVYDLLYEQHRGNVVLDYTYKPTPKQLEVVYHPDNPGFVLLGQQGMSVWKIMYLNRSIDRFVTGIMLIVLCLVTPSAVAWVFLFARKKGPVEVSASEVISECKACGKSLKGCHYGLRFCPWCGEENNREIPVRKYGFFSEWIFEIMLALSIFLVSFRDVVNGELPTGGVVILLAALVCSGVYFKRCSNCSYRREKIGAIYCGNCGKKYKATSD